ncbi:hypothetical protein VXQ18_13435 [Brucella abortus]|nr:hypothetical protein [Brucella abortus]
MTINALMKLFKLCCQHQQNDNDSKAEHDGHAARRFAERGRFGKRDDVAAGRQKRGGSRCAAAKALPSAKSSRRLVVIATERWRNSRLSCGGTAFRQRLQWMTSAHSGHPLFS